MCKEMKGLGSFILLEAASSRGRRSVNGRRGQRGTHVKRRRSQEADSSTAFLAGLLLEAGAAVPAEVERAGIVLAAARADDGRAGDARLQVGVDYFASARRVLRVHDPELRERGIDGKLAREARGVRVEDLRANAPVGEPVGEEVRFGQVGRCVDALQNFTEIVPVKPSSLMPERPETL